MNQEQIKQFIGMVVAQKEAVIRDALGGDEVNMIKVRSMANLVSMPDGSEILMYEDKPVLQFMPVEFEQVCGSGAMVVRVTQDYKKVEPQ